MDTLDSGVESHVKGDRVEIVVDAGGVYGTARTYEIAATRAGRRVEVRTGRGQVEVTEVTRGGTPVRRALSRPVARVGLDIALVLTLPAIATPTGAAD